MASIQLGEYPAQKLWGATYLEEMGHDVRFFEPRGWQARSLQMVSRKLRQASVVAISLGSTDRALGMSEICDAIALGKPLVVTRSKHLGFDVEEVGCGFFVAAGDVAGWATALARLHRDADLRRKLGEAGPGGSWARQVRHYAEHHANATLCGRQVEAALLRVLRRS